MKSGSQERGGTPIISMNFFRSIAAILPLPAIIASIACISGCNHSNASRATFDPQRTMSLAQADRLGADLVAQIVANPNFQHFRKSWGSANPDGLTIQITWLECLDEMREGPQIAARVDDSVEKHLLDNSITVRQRPDRGVPDYVSGLQEYGPHANADEAQDSDTRLGQVAKAGQLPRVPLTLSLTLQRHIIGNRTEFALSGKLVEVGSKSVLLRETAMSPRPSPEPASEPASEP